MKKNLLLFCSVILTLTASAQHVYISTRSSASFFSRTIAADIEGKSNAGNSVLDIQTRETIFKVSNTSFQFEKKLMQEHFNENYMESDKYPFSVFRGKIKEDVDLSKDGTYNVTVAGILSVHGLDKLYESKAVFTVDKGIISASTVFNVKIADHQIKIPSIVFKKIAESVEVRISAVYQAKTV